jgi:tetratricopeptide repeat protein
MAALVPSTGDPNVVTAGHEHVGGNMPGGDAKKKTCFVVMGFGEKTDYQSNPQRVLNLDRTFEGIIQPAVKAAGLECLRADKINHSGVIDKPMYEQLLAADLVIADLSTSNFNAIYELGVRHALRPYTTIVMAEDKFVFPFDINHVSITKYEHLGKDIGLQEALRMQGILETKIREIIDKAETDSPVFMFLPELSNGKSAVAAAAPAPVKDTKSLAELMESFKEAKRDTKEPSDWLVVVALLRRMQKVQPDDPYIVQQLALATYKSKHPDAATSLENARTILETLAPDTTSDAETAGLWGAIHKRLWDVGKNREHLDKAVRSYARGYFIRDDYYTGINFAYLLNVRAALEDGEDATTDRVFAKRIRREVLALCDAALAALPPATETTRAKRGEDEFWINATKVEALLGLGNIAESDALKAVMLRKQPTPQAWMVEAMTSQLEALAKLYP